MLEVDEFNPARKKLKTPFLRKAHHSPSFKKTTTAHQSCLLSHTNTHNITYLQQLQAKTAEKLSTHLEHSIDRQLLRKKSSLIELNLKYIDLQEKYTALLEKKNNLTCNTEPDFQQLSNISEKRSQTNRGRLERLKAIKTRLAKIALPHFFTVSAHARGSRSLK